MLVDFDKLSATIKISKSFTEVFRRLNIKSNKQKDLLKPIIKGFDTSHFGIGIRSTVSEKLADDREWDRVWDKWKDPTYYNEIRGTNVYGGSSLNGETYNINWGKSSRKDVRE